MATIVTCSVVSTPLAAPGVWASASGDRWFASCTQIRLCIAVARKEFRLSCDELVSKLRYIWTLICPVEESIVSPLNFDKMGLATTVFSAVFLATGGFLFGYDSGIITSTIALPTFEEYFNNPNDTTTGGIVSAFQGGAIAGTIFNMLFAHNLGRRWTIMIGALVSVFGSALQAGAVNMAMLIVGRFIGGFAVGQLTSTIPLYAAELSEAKYRGVLSGLLQWMLSWGFLVAQWLGYGCSFNSTQFSCK